MVNSKDMVRHLSYVLLCFGILAADTSLGQDAREIVRRADEHAKGKTSTAELTIETVRPGWSRTMTLRSWTKGNDFAMIRILTPAKDAGVTYLKRDKEVWNWIPSIERTIKLPPSMMSQSWMGTDFTNDDLVKEASILEDYTHALAGDTVIDGRPCYKIRLVPKAEATVVWGKLVMYIDKVDDLMLLVHYYDEDGYRVNTMSGSAITMLGGRKLPSRLEMVPADKPGHKTIMTYSSIVFDKPIDDAFFTPQQMTRLK